MRAGPPVPVSTGTPDYTSAITPFSVEHTPLNVVGHVLCASTLELRLLHCCATAVKYHAAVYHI